VRYLREKEDHQETFMTESQARELGRLISKARKARGMSTRELADVLGVARGWVSGIEQGRYTHTAADRLARLVDVLDIEPAQIDRLTRGAFTDGLPSIGTYFRAKYSLSREDSEKVEGYIAKLRRRHG
jgi:transcriptional regulator with XRE-family HTH domain